MSQVICYGRFSADPLWPDLGDPQGLTECGATSPCSEADHYASTHDECDKVLVKVYVDGPLSLCALLETAEDDGKFMEPGFAAGWVEYDSKERREIL
jgi:hypothetical protein